MNTDSSETKLPKFRLLRIDKDDLILSEDVLNRLHGEGYELQGVSEHYLLMTLPDPDVMNQDAMQQRILDMMERRDPGGADFRQLEYPEMDPDADS